MSVLNDGAAFLKAVLGLKVSRPTAVLPATTQAAIFTIGAGRVIVTSLVGTTAGGGIMSRNGIVVPVGTIDLSCAASNTGSIKWDITYVPLDDGASITAA